MEKTGLPAAPLRAAVVVSFTALLLVCTLKKTAEETCIEAAPHKNPAVLGIASVRVRCDLWGSFIAPFTLYFYFNPSCPETEGELLSCSDTNMKYERCDVQVFVSQI